MVFLKYFFQNRYRLVVIMLVILLVAGIVVFLANYLDPNVDRLNQEQIDAVKNAYLQERLADGYPSNMTVNDIYVAEYYGIYDDCIVLMIEDCHTMYAQAIGDETIAGVTIRYNDANRIVAYKDGSLYTLQEAYNLGYLTRGNIMQIRSIHYFPT